MTIYSWLKAAHLYTYLRGMYTRMLANPDAILMLPPIRAILR